MRGALDARHIGQVIAAYRHHPVHGETLPQEAVGRWVGISQAQLSRLENGPPVKDLDKLALWARTLQIPEHLLWFKLPVGRPTPEVHGEPAEPSSVFVPPVEPGTVDRPDDLETVVASLAAAIEGDAVSRVVAISGPGGFGKTTLASQVCRDHRIAELVTDILWVETGEHCTPTRVVQLISDLCIRLGGVRPELSDAEQTGFHLARMLADRRVLIVIDNVWSAEDVNPFLLGGTNTVRLVTTRNARTCPSRTLHVRLGPMSTRQVADVLDSNVPSLGHRGAARLAELCRGWPLLASVVGSNVRQDVAAGAPHEHAVAVAEGALEVVGPPAFDVWDTDHRMVLDGAKALARAVRDVGRSGPSASLRVRRGCRRSGSRAAWFG